MSDPNNNESRDLRKDSSRGQAVGRVEEVVGEPSAAVDKDLSPSETFTQELPSSQTSSLKSSSQTSSSLGPEGQSLLCSESMLSSTTSSEESLHLSQHDAELNPQVWKYESSFRNQRQHSPHKLSCSALNKESNCRDTLTVPVPVVGALSARYSASVESAASASSSVSSLSRRATVGSLLNQVDEKRVEGYAGPLDRRMNANGLDRTAMTGSSTTTSENLSWLGTRTCTSQAQRHPSGIITSIPGHGSHDHHPLMLPGPGPSSLIRPSATGADVHPRSYVQGQYPVPIYTTTGNSLSPFSPAPGPFAAVAGSGQSQALGQAPYAFFPQYPQAGSFTAGASGGFLAGAPTPFHPSFASVLQSFVPESPQLPRHGLPYAPALHPSYPHGPLSSPASSPGPSSLHRTFTPSHSLTPTQSLPHSHTSLDSRKSPKLEPKDTSPRVVRRVASPKDVKPMQPSSLPPHLRHGVHYHPSMRESPPSEHSSSSSRPSATRDSGRKRSAYLSHETHETKHGTKCDDSLHKRQRLGGAVTITQPPPTQAVHTTNIPHSSPSLQTAGQPPPGGSSANAASYPTPHYPPHFMKGSIIQLANGDLKRVEDLRTEDFVSSAEVSTDLKVDSSTVVRIEENTGRDTAILGFSVGEHRIQVTVEATLEHPFFVFGQGWSSCSPERTLQRYGLQCARLLVGDVCISLTHKDPGSQAAVLAASQQLQGHREQSPMISEQRRGTADLWRPTDRPHTVTTSATVTTSSTSSSTTSGSRAAATTSPSRSPRSAAAPRRVGSETRHTPNPPHIETSPSGGQSGLTSYPASLSRRRRWSAPDQLHTDVKTLKHAGSPSASNQPSTSGQVVKDEPGSGDGKTGKQQQPDQDKKNSGQHSRT